jgi:hypothetical protein
MTVVCGLDLAEVGRAVGAARRGRADHRGAHPAELGRIAQRPEPGGVHPAQFRRAE